jgi:hypothetical protein
VNRIRSAAVSETSRSAPKLSRTLRLVPLAPHTAAIRDLEIISNLMITF